MADTKVNAHTAIRIVIANGDPDALAAFRIAFAPDTNPEIVGAASTSEELMKVLSATTCDALLLDYNVLGRASVFSAVKSRYPALRIIYLAQSPIPEEVHALAQRQIIAGYAEKKDNTDETVFAIETILEGPPIGVAAPPADSLGSSQLSAREQEVLRCYLDGMAITEIASKLHRSRKTISTQKQQAYRKLGIKIDAELFAFRTQLYEKL